MTASANLQQVLTSGTQTDKAPVYDSDRSAKHLELRSRPYADLRFAADPYIYSAKGTKAKGLMEPGGEAQIKAQAS
ncbi:hypothetical protein Tco_1561944 [Tanacetum coccineum]